MKREFLFICLFLFSNGISFAQSQNELEQRMGFKGIILGSQIEENTELEYKKDHKDKPTYSGTAGIHFVNFYSCLFSML